MELPHHGGPLDAAAWKEDEEEKEEEVAEEAEDEVVGWVWVPVLLLFMMSLRFSPYCDTWSPLAFTLLVYLAVPCLVSLFA